MQLTKLLLILLFFTIPFIHAKILPTLGIDFFFQVSGNFEFTKAIYFNIFSGIIFFSFFVEKIITSVFVPQISFSTKETKKSSPSKRGMSLATGGALIILIISTLFSISPFTSLMGDTEKGHTALLFFNLLGLFLLLQNLEKEFLKKLIFTSLLAGVGVSLLALKELFFETYNYGELSSRALGSFGHPNYLAGYLLLLLPFLFPFKNGSSSPFPKETSERRSACTTILKLKRSRIHVWIRIIIILLFFITLFFTKSIWALCLAVGYIVILSGILSLKKRKKLQYTILMICFIVTFFFLIQFFPEKLHSFLSRFYIWETTLKIIFSDPKIFFFGGGAETLPYFFDSFKVPEVYIFENFGFTADRPHNFFLNIFFHIGVFGTLLFLYLVVIFLKSFRKDFSSEKISIMLFLLFGIFHFFSIASYVLVILVISVFSVASFPCKGKEFKIEVLGKKEKKGIIIGTIVLLITLFSLLGAYFSIKLYQSEILFKNKNYTGAQENFSHPKYLIELGKYEEAEKSEGTFSQSNLRDQLITSSERFTLCETLTQKYRSAENYFYCGDLFWRLGKENIAKIYYTKGLLKLPDLWNKDSLYWNNYFIKNTITGNRFFSPKFSSLSEILEKVKAIK